MWVTYSKKGTRVESYCWDWCCMNKIITDYQEDLGVSFDEAHTRFWEDVQNCYPEEFAERLEGRTIAEAIADVKFWDDLFVSGWADEIRADYLNALDIKCTQEGERNPFFSEPFTDDPEKMRDFRALSKDEFLQSYSYLTEEEYDATAAVARGSRGGIIRTVKRKGAKNNGC